jgi:hypothetical protein
MPVIPATWEVEIGRITVSGQPRQKVCETISTNKLEVVTHICNPSYLGDKDRIWLETSPSKMLAGPTS